MNKITANNDQFSSLAVRHGEIDAIFDAESLQLIVQQSATPLALGNVVNESLNVSREVFDNKTVIGSAIKTKMFFDNREPAWSAPPKNRIDRKSNRNQQEKG